jgi:hypothetical protein
MSKRDNTHKRIEKDFYPTIDDRAVIHLLPHLKNIHSYVEPCCGQMHLVRMLERLAPNILCYEYSDIDNGQDALQINQDYMLFADAIITNPPWSRDILHPMIMHFKELAPTWLLFDADWAHTKQAIPYLKFCTDIVSVGRLIWIEGTKTSGKDNCAWYRFDKQSEGITFHPKSN